MGNLDTAATRPTTTAVRQAVTGHNVRYVLAFGLAGVITAFALVAFLGS
jgi:hypothetical protein